MKKIVVILLLFSLFIPVNAAVTVKSTSITGNEKVKVGDKVKLTFKINFSGIDKTSQTADGILFAGFMLDYDDSILDIVEVSSDGSFESEVYKDDETNEYAVLSVITDGIPSRSRCANSVLYCDDYSIDITFYVKNAKEYDTSISMSDVGIALVNLKDIDENFSEDDVKLIEGKGDSYHRIEIEESNTKVTNPPKSIVEDKKPDINIENTITNLETEKETSSKKKDNESSNNNLKSLEIEGYEIDFKSSEKFYDIIIPNDVNSLDIKVETEDSKATYEVIGATDLSKNNHKVVIEVTAENGEKSKYTISAKTEEMIAKTDKEEVKKEKFKLEKKYLIIGGIILGGIILIALIIFIIIKIRDRKLEKGLKNL